MNFTAQEMKLLQRLRKRERQWRWVRWLLLVTGIFCIGLCAMFGFLLHSLIDVSDHGQFNTTMVFFMLLIWTKCCFYFIFGVWCLATVNQNWHGDVNRMLLLKLLDAQENDAQKALLP